IAMIKSQPPTVVFAEPSTITGSIGVYAAFPNVKKFADDNGIKVNVIKAGDLKNSGSMFHEMGAEERRVWQDMVDHAYLRFLDVIGEARAKLTRAELQKDVDMAVNLPIRAGKDRRRRIAYQRYRADGAIFTANQALELGLIDRIGYLDDAVEKAATLAGLGDDYRVITYNRPPSLLGSLLGIQAANPALQLDASRVGSA